MSSFPLYQNLHDLQLLNVKNVSVGSLSQQSCQLCERIHPFYSNDTFFLL